MFGTSPGGSVDESMLAFRRAVEADIELQDRLAAIENPDLFVAEAVGAAGALGLSIGPAAVEAAIRPDPVDVGRFLPAPEVRDSWPSRHWLPLRSAPTGGAPAFDWGWVGEHPLVRPFFGDETRCFAPRPFNLMFRTRTDLEALVRGYEGRDHPAPSGFIYHMSRCGSTLAARMLAAEPEHTVLSEAEPLDAVILWALASGAPREDQVIALRAVVAALGRDRSQRRQRRFFKLDSWHVLALPLLRAAFPRTPWAFLYRNPVEVLVSQERARGVHTVPGLLPSALLEIPGGEGMPPNHYAALVIKRMSEALLEHWALGGGLLINYDEMPGAVVERLAPHFGIELDSERQGVMRAAALHDSKSPDRIFAPDASAKRRDAPPELARVAEEVVGPAYRALESLRTGCFSGGGVR